ncbi:mitogen-activated protein kinase kinase kinase 5-like [Argentina anserina]|uniref:mitogen-activated protein kinase kinase kinase 5-like n=1 Tax=Argentina anserina TaxID=57926 RepID=UPI002176900C|nr:mitogen-activated protein kinase kinase kinase 5-like [Potentilla anserina]
MSPEVSLHGIQEPPTDIWALGCTVVQMLTEVEFWDVTELGDGSGVSIEIPVIPETLSNEAKDFLGKGFILDPLERSNAGGVSELLGISDRFGWDNDDKVGWSKVNFELLGTSKGGRIPRRKSESEAGVEEREKKKKGAEGLGEKRRMRMQRDEGRVGKEEKKGLGDRVGLLGRSNKENGENEKFPGRESLLRKAYIRRFL